MNRNAPGPPELLAPAGDFASACAAIEYGADAVYLGLPRFSARAEAENFTPDQLRRIVAWAHGRPRPRRVYATFNTLIRDDELEDAAASLEQLSDSGIDAVILQDLGLYSLAASCFPDLRLHASTQMAVHNLDGARALADLGFARVVLARELTLAEVSAIARQAGIEVEVFVHGALCYSYSGLCLFSSHENGRSGNRGRCAYCCREAFHSGDGRQTVPYSMRDLALAPALEAVAATGAASLKIEGRMKSPLYVACVTDYYRRKLDGALCQEDETRMVEDIRTVFSRPWTTLYASGAGAVPAAVVDPGALGHRGAPIGEVEAVVGDAAGAWLRFKTRRSIEKHDGIQLDPARGGRPFGFAVISLRRSGSRRLEVTLPAGTVVEILLPAGEKPPAAKGATVYCSASQSVRREYTLVHPKASDCRQVFPVSVEAGLNVNGALFRARAAPARKGLPDVTASHAVAERLGPASDPARTVAAVRRAFSRTGNTCWSLSDITVLNPAGLYAPPSLLNEGRRVLLDLLSAEREKQRAGVLAAARAACARVEACPEPDRDGRVRVPTRWTAKVSLEGPVYHALADADEVVIQIGHMPQARREERIEAWLPVTGRDRLRLALPLIARDREAVALRRDAARLAEQGWTRWEAPGLAGLRILRDTLRDRGDITADWSLYGLNRLAREAIAGQGVSRAVLSPEDGAANIAALAGAGGPEAEAIVFQHTPLFISETAPCADWAKNAGTIRVCGSRGRGFIVHRVDGRWITASRSPFCLARHTEALARRGVPRLRVDLSWSPPECVSFPECWQDVRSGRAPAESREANFESGLE